MSGVRAVRGFRSGGAGYAGERAAQLLEIASSSSG